MLKELHIENFALISNLTAELEEGLHMITGETGSGKSILIDALSFCLGKRGDKGFVRDQSKKAIVEALFIDVNPLAWALLEEVGIEKEESLVLTRELNAEGKTTARVNHRVVNTSLLKNLGNMLVHIHGQNEFESLSGSKEQLRLLDDYLGDRIMPSLAVYQELYQDRKTLESKLEQIQEFRDEHQISRDIDLLKFQIQEIEESHIGEGEIEALEEEAKILSHAEKIRSAVDESMAALDSEHQGVLNGLSLASRALKEAGAYHNALEECAVRLQDAFYEVEDIKNTVSQLQETLGADPYRLEEVHNRLDHIHKIKRKYGNSTEEIFSFLEKAKEQLKEIESREERSRQYKDEITKNTRKMELACYRINEIREDGAKELGSKILQELESLQMKNVRFQIYFSPKEFSINGNTAVNYKISFNKGEELKNLNKVASGGEISRFMLAIKHVTAEADTIGTLIFDEIDTGVSGVAAQTIGEKMAQIACHRQVISVTHLPQIAAWAKIHYNVEKVEDHLRMNTRIIRLDFSQRIDEIAKMTGGIPITDIARANAKELLERYQSIF